MKSSEDIDGRAARTRRRATWPVRRTDANDDGRAELCAATTPQERVAMMAELAREAWALAGKPWPNYARGDAPIRRTTLAEL